MPHGPLYLLAYAIVILILFVILLKVVGLAF